MNRRCPVLSVHVFHQTTAIKPLCYILSRQSRVLPSISKACSRRCRWLFMLMLPLSLRSAPILASKLSQVAGKFVCLLPRAYRALANTAWSLKASLAPSQLVSMKTCKNARGLWSDGSPCRQGMIIEMILFGHSVQVNFILGGFSQTDDPPEVHHSAIVRAV